MRIIILKRTCVIIPSELRQCTLALAHEGHRGLVKTRQLLWEKIWFLRIDQEVEKLLNGCLACQATGPNTKLDPIQMSQKTPWHTVHTDFWRVSSGCHWCIFSVPGSWHCSFHNCQRNNLQTWAYLFYTWNTSSHPQWQWPTLHKRWNRVIHGRD